jgi:hypothetical protein
VDIVEIKLENGRTVKAVPLQINGSTINVMPLKYSKSKLFAQRLEKVDLERREKVGTTSGWTFLYESADIVVDMLVAATGRTKEEVEEVFTLADAPDWLLYLQHGPEVIEKKMAVIPTITTT